MSLTVNCVSYYYGHLAAQAIESVLNQTQKPDVIRLYDDGAFDCGFLRKIYPEVEIVTNPENMGIVDNFNWMLKRTQTEKVLMLGADNWLHPQAIELMLQPEEDIVSCDAYIVGEGKYRRWTLPYQPHGSAMYDVAKAKEVGGYEPSGREHTEEDSMLFNKMMSNGATFHRVDKPLLYYRRHRKNFNQ